MIDRGRPEAIRSELALLTALAHAIIVRSVGRAELGEPPSQTTLANRAGMSSKTVSRHLPGEKKIKLWRQMAAATSQYGAKASFAEAEGSAKHASLRQAFDSFRMKAVEAVDQVSGKQAFVILSEMAEFRDQLKGDERVSWGDLWQSDGVFYRKWGPSVPIEGMLWGLAQTYSDGQNSENLERSTADVQGSPASESLPDPTLLHSLELVTHLGEFVRPEDMRISQHPRRLTVMLAFIAGALLAGNFRRAREFIERLKGDGVDTLDCAWAALLSDHLGTGLLVDSGAEGEDGIFASQQHMMRAREVLSELNAWANWPRYGFDQDVVVHDVWDAWINGDLDAVLRRAPFVDGSYSIRGAIVTKSAWTALVELIPILHEAASQRGYADLAAYLSESATDFLERSLNGRQNPIPLGLYARMLAISAAGIGRTEAWCWNAPVPFDPVAVTQLRVRLAMGGELEPIEVEDLRKALSGMPGFETLTRTGRFKGTT